MYLVRMYHYNTGWVHKIRENRNDADQWVNTMSSAGYTDITIWKLDTGENND